ncbi:M28 family peptidase [Shewanella sp. DNRA4]|uniref:M28 family peptidase n=1 Tax=Shewanella sp. DNRA4 TaxID=2723055 RepID=UPI00146F6717|nr:M28 family peptidase [Shewanella sp. DNRA4]NMD50740.1 M28 family peptidase [Shewanella sp. DNRA4]
MGNLAHALTAIIRSWSPCTGLLRVFTLSLCMGLIACTSQPAEYTCSPEAIRLNWAAPADLKQTVATLSSAELMGRKTQTEGAAKARDYLNRQFQQLGLKPWGTTFEVPFEYSTLFSQEVGSNLVALAPARQPTDKWRIVVAHYDHLGMSGGKVYHGADDNASGVAALLAIANHWQRAAPDSLPNINLMFVATDAEEPGLFGSTALVEQLKQRMPEAQFELMLNLDMIGHPSRPYAIYLEGSRNFYQFPQFRPMLNQSNGLCIKLSHPKPVGRSIQSTNWLRASDHYPFHQAKIPWLYFGVPTHPQYHTPEDTYETLDYVFLAAVAESAFELIKLDGNFLKN